jgi:hypothetical protein
MQTVIDTVVAQKKMSGKKTRRKRMTEERITWKTSLMRTLPWRTP